MNKAQTERLQNIHIESRIYFFLRTKWEPHKLCVGGNMMKLLTTIQNCSHKLLAKSSFFLLKLLCQIISGFLKMPSCKNVQSCGENTNGRRVLQFKVIADSIIEKKTLFRIASSGWSVSAQLARNTYHTYHTYHDTNHFLHICIKYSSVTGGSYVNRML